ncbi:amino acid adenylation domain-containing protein [Micromonospora sp. WMMD961]|uniref:non-ribosomal peptide synthetase/MFS transporter n=1 Tax=Micromonospora sp. WMMD961 TaxID=3016100 RepID=UPI0024177525|nr:non-ribosomal peptide synthetase/MFS transporter [Micromonospora sp. WMMD961]MDG4783344.1 amino acid adenylation domain-containing protein [Micromonospora sp. WMMD961]
MSQAIDGRRIALDNVVPGEMWAAIAERAGRVPAAVALVEQSAEVTYAALVEQVEALAVELVTAGVGVGDLVGIRLPRGRQAIIAILAALRAGAGYVPLDPAYPADRIRLMLSDARPRVVIDENGVSSSPDARRSASDTAYVIFTSGSTGRPKGVMVPRRALDSFCRAAVGRYELTEADRMLQFASLSFDASIEELFPPLVSGATVVIRDEDMISRPDLFLDRCAALGVTVLDLPTAYWHELVGALVRGEVTLPATVRLVIIGGEAARADLIRGWQEVVGTSVRLLNTYGPTETTVVATVADLTTWTGGAVPIGHPLPGVTCRIVDDSGAEAEVGELLIGGAGVATGYLHQPALTAERFRPGPDGQPEYRSGDRVRRGADGGFEFLGRADDQVKVRGFRIELGEIETALRDVEHVSDAVVVVQDRDGQQRLVGHVVAAPGVDLAAVRASLADRLPAYLVPAVLTRHDTFPIGPQGKIDRRALATTTDEPPVTDWSGLTPAQAEVAALWRTLLGVGEVRPDDDFLALGGSSLAAIRLIGALRQRHGVNLTLSELYAAPALAALAARLGTGPGVDEMPADGVPAGVPLALSPLQRDFWVAERVCAELPAHTLGARFRWDGRIDVDALTRGLRELTRRHPLLRARFPDDGAEPRLVIDDDAVIPLTEAPRSDLAVEKFDLANGPLARAVLVRTDGDDELVLFVHHLVYDGWSSTVVGTELAALYQAALRRPDTDDLSAAAGLPRAPAVPDLAARYATAKADATLTAYWRSRFADADLDLEVPADRPRPVVRSFASARISRRLDPALLRRVTECGQAHQASLFMVVLAGLQAVLHRYTGRDDITILSPVAGRTSPDLEDVVGPLLNILPLRGDVAGEPSFAELLARVRRTVLDDLDHQGLALPDLIDALRRPGSGNRNRLSPVMLTVHNTPEIDHPGVRYVGEVPPAATLVDLGISLDFPDGGPVLNVDYATELFDRARVEALVGHLLTLLDAAVSAPRQTVGRLALLTVEEQQRIVHGWNDSVIAVPDATAVHQLFERRVAATPDAPALTFRDTTVSYRELNGRANRLARRLRDEGVGPGDRVAICLDRGIDLFVAMWAVLKAGGAYVPLDPAYPPERLDYMRRDSRAAVFVDDDYLRGPLPSEQDDLPLVNASTDPAYVIYTSGSSGKAKGVVVNHGNLVHAARMWQHAYHLEPGWTYQQAASFSFDMFVGETLRALCTGGRLVVVPRETLLDPADLYALMRAEQVQCTELVPAVLRNLLAYADQTGQSLDFVRLLVGGGEKWHVREYELARRLVGPGNRVVNAYGVTEVTVDNVYFDGPVDHLADEAPLPIGRPFPNNRVYVLDAYRQPVPPGVVGELYLGGLGVAPGYHDRPELTTDRFVPDPYAPEPDARMYRTGDSARYHLGGDVDFLGRLDDQVKVNGYRVELGEVEAALGALPNVVACAVAVHPLPSGVAQLVGYVVPGGDEPVDEVSIRDALAKTLPVHMVPARLVSLPALPLTPNGKLDRRRLPAPAHATGDAAGTAARTPLERQIAGVWSEVLGIDEISIDDSFFALGGDSFAALRVIRRIEPAPALLDIYQHPTVRRLAAALGERDPDSLDERRMLHRLTASDADLASGGVTVVAVPYSGGSAIAYQPLAAALPSNWALQAVELPGHDHSRPDEELLSARAVADLVLAELRDIDGPILLYGHCLGVAATVEIARRAEEAGVPLAGVALGAGFPTARLPGRFFDWFYRLVPTDRFTSDREYLAYLRGRGGFTDVDDPAQEAFVLRNVRHDARDAEEYFTAAYQRQAERLRTPVLAVVGARDRVTEHYQERHQEWGHFADEVGLAVLPKAGHFFVKSHAEPLAQALVSFVEPAPSADENAPAAPPAPPRRQGPEPSLSRFALVALGQLVSMVGSGLSALVLSIWVFQRTGSITDFAVVNAVGLLPGILVGPLAGAVADRWNRRTVMLASDGASAAAMAALAVVVFSGGGLQLWHVYLAVSVTSLAGAFQRPAYLAAVAQLVPKRYLGHANGISQLGVSVGLVFAPMLGAGLVGLIGVPGVIAIDVVSFAIGVLTLLAVRFPDLMFHRREETFRTEITAGWRYITRRPGLRAALRFFVIDHAFYTLGFAVITPMLLIEQSPAVLGLALGAGGLGGLVGSLTMGLWGGTARRANGLIIFMGVGSLAMAVVGLGNAPVLVVAGMFLVTFGESLAEGHWIALVQTKVGFELQGRVLSIFITVMMLTMPVGYLIVGPLAERYVQPLLEPGGALAGSVGHLLGTGPGRGLALLVVVSGLLQLAWAVRGWFTPRLRLLEDHLPDALPPAEIGSRDELQREADALLALTR